MFVESIEARYLMSGDVAVFSGHDSLTFSGDASSNAFVISQSNKVLTVTGLRGTTVDGAAERRFDIRPKYIFHLNQGDDSVTVTGTLPSLYFNGGSGDDTLMLETATVSGSVYFSGRSGNDKIWMKSAAVTKDVSVTGGYGADRVFVEQGSIGRDFIFGDGAQSSRFSLDTLTVRGKTFVHTGNSVDYLNITDSTFVGFVDVALRGGDDGVIVRGSVFKTSSPFDVGTGDNHVDREVVLSWNFANGLQGWGGGFSDFSPITVNPGEDGYSRFDFVNKIAPLPRELGLHQTGYEFSARNLSDDLFAFLTRPVTADDGIIGGVSYNVNFDIRFASNVPAGLGGVGGPPAEAVFLKVGGVPYQPKVYSDKNGDLSINLNKQSVDMSGAGDIRNGEVFGPGDSLNNSGKTKYKLVRRVKTHDNPVVSHKSGRLWLIFGTDSGFEGRTTLYYASVSVRLTPATS